MKVIIAGTRTFEDFIMLAAKCDKILANQDEVEIVSGGAPGTDTMAEWYAKARGYKFTLFEADWDRLGKYADACILFWDGVSPGTKSMKDLAETAGLKIRVVYYKNQ